MFSRGYSLHIPVQLVSSQAVVGDSIGVQCNIVAVEQNDWDYKNPC